MADVTLPQLGETVTEGTITQWFKHVGDTVAADEPLFEVSTDKVDTEVPSPVAGTLTEIRVQEGETVGVGTVIAIVGDGDGTAPTAAPPAAEEAPAEEPPAAEEAPAEEPPQAEPDAAPESAGATEAPAAETTAEVEPAEQAAPEPPEAAPAAEPATAPAPAAPGTKGILLSPVVRRLVSEHGLDPAAINGTGPGGRITRDDVLDHIDKVGAKPSTAAAEVEPEPAAEEAAAPAAKAAPEPEPAAKAPAPARAAPAAAPTVTAGQRDETIRLTKIRRLTGQHMVMSKGVSPHAFSVVEVDYANVDETRGAVKNEWRKAEGFSLTYLPFISRATIDSLADFPHLNASVAENDLVVHHYVDLGIAVDLDYNGLIVPVIRDAGDLRLRAIARQINDLANRARTRKLGPDEISGGTFTVSNNGSAGSVLTMPIINQPQVAILSTDAITRKPVVVATADGGEAIAIHPVGNLAMSWDHRAFDGAYAAGFLKRIKEILETRDWSSEV
jgi:pyruvate/2-oxoglutarate dehydrogenase complex dihydrolipoamide acyltransferase (E2) component